jgi:hypothetical protein
MGGARQIRKKNTGVYRAQPINRRQTKRKPPKAKTAGRLDRR